MGTIARIFIATSVCPTLGGVVGQDVARAAGRTAHVAVGVLARWEVIGLLAGVSAGLLYAALTIYCLVACGERVRTRVADPIVLTLGALAVVELALRRTTAAPALIATVRATTTFAWLLGLLFVVLAVEYGPRAPAPAAAEPRDDERPSGAIPGQEGLNQLRQRVLAGEHSEEGENG